jgi:hypothetical protein
MFVLIDDGIGITLILQHFDFDFMKKNSEFLFGDTIIIIRMVKKVSSKFRVYKFLVFSEFKYVTACLLFFEHHQSIQHG